MRSIATALFGLVVCVGNAAAQQQNAPKQEIPEIVTSAIASVTQVPDRARVTVSHSAESKRAKDASEKLGLVINAVRDGAVALGVNPSSISSMGYGVEQKTDDDGRAKGYIATQSLSIEVANFDQLGPLIDASLAAGASSVGQIEFLVRDADAARERALRVAIGRARREAELLSAESGCRLLRPISISTDHYPGISSVAETVTVTSAAPNTRTIIPSREVTTTVSVGVQWLLDPACRMTPE